MTLKYYVPEAIKMKTKLLLFFVLFDIIVAQPGLNPLPDEVIVIQNLHGVCNSIWNPLTRMLQDRNSYLINSHSEEQRYYEPGQNCVVTLIGKLGWQWNIRIRDFDVNGEVDAAGKPTKCVDFLKLYDAERCDNAKLLKGIDYETGLCGTLTQSQIGNLDFTTCANKLTIQFKTEVALGNTGRNGFSMDLTQSSWSNPTGGPDCDYDLNGIASGVWRDGTFTEFQNTWSDQPIIPGYVSGGNDANYDKEIVGIKCYTCLNCPVEPFEPEKDNTAQDTNCYICSKTWDEEYQLAKRSCYTRSDYLNLIQSLKEITEPFTGCKQSVDEYSRTRNYCFCDSDLCNTGTRALGNYATLFATILVTLLAKL